MTQLERVQNDIGQAKQKNRHSTKVGTCTAMMVGSDDVASSYCIGVLMGHLAGRREGSWGARVVASY